MKRTFNYTGRKKVERRDTTITLREERGALVFDADLRLAAYNFPRNAEIWLEAHRQNLWMQFAWGTISNLHPPADRKLTEFDVADGILFRVRIVQPLGQEHHKLLGEADGISFVKVGEATDQRQPLLVPVPEALDQLLWKLDTESEPPRLLVNKEAKPSWKELARSPHFIALVYPEVLRRLLTRALIDQKWTEEDDEGGSASDWLRFTKNLGVPWPPPLPDMTADCEQWIDEAVAAFSRRNQLRNVWDLTCDEEGRQ